MATEVKLPQLGQTMEEGTVVNCLVKIGDEVKKGSIIFEIETDKATLEMESPADGFVKHIIAQTGQTLPVGDLMMILGGKDEKIEQPGAATQASAPASTATSTSTTTPPATVETPSSANVVKLPQLGQTMEEGTVVNCLVKTGDEVKKGSIIFEIETDKTTLEMESPADGFVKAIIAETGQTLPVGDAMLILGVEDQDLPQSFIDSVKRGAEPAATLTPAPVQTAEPAPVAIPAQPTKTADKVIASPRAKRVAKELGVNMATVTGTGPGGRITEDDVKKAGSTAPTKTESESDDIKLGQTIPLNRLQKITGQRMLKSKQEIPCFYLTVKADVTNLVEHRANINQSGKVKISYNDFIMRAVAMAMEKFPVMTGQLDGETIKLADNIGIGLAISVPGGLVAPIVKDVNKKNITQIATYSLALIERAKANKLSPDDVQGGCITVSNLGAFGIDSFIPIVVPGQCSILGIGQISDTCMQDNGNIITRKLMNMTLSVDHKIANGAYAAQFLDMVRKLLEDPSTLT